GPAEAEELVRECLTLTHKRLDAALSRIFERLQGAAPEDREPTQIPPVAPAAAALDSAIATAVHGKRALFASRFRAAFDESLQRRRAGQVRPRTQRSGTVELAIVEVDAHSAQVTLKTAVNAMREATLEEAFALDFRIRMILREPPPAGAFDNPLSHEYICDALGVVCRQFWPKDGLWRTIMERVVIGITPAVAALHRELNVLLQDRDVLPELRVRTHAKAGKEALPNRGSRALYDRLVQLVGAKRPTGGGTAASEPAPSIQGVPSIRGAPSIQGSMAGASTSMWPRSGMMRGKMTRGGTAPGAGAAPGDWLAQQNALIWSALVGALADLQRGAPIAAGLTELAGVDRDALRSGSASQLRTIQRAFQGKGGSPADRVAIDVVTGVLDYVLADPYLAGPIKGVFGRLQIPLLRAALIEPGALSNRQHPVRRFFDTLALAAVDLDPQTERGRALIDLSRRLADLIHDDFSDDLKVFATATRELESFLDAERAELNARLAEAVPPLIAQDERDDARSEALGALDARLAGRPIPPEIRAFLDHECVARLAAICLRGGPEGPAWEAELETLDDLLWSISPKTTATAKKKLAASLPGLLKRIDRDWPPEAEAQARREALMSCLLDLHLRAIRAASEPPGAKAEPTAVFANATVSPPPPEPDEFDEQVIGLVRGDWVEFRGEGETVLARLAWRAPQRRRLLFTHRDGRTAFVHTPASLAALFRNGRAVLAVEAVPLFDRAMAKLVDER
ncbi:MAG TPA: DUF1631 family protein, partial [Casimicrobiaceae bacterium]|nr:DUF1631 family protein [Casimicrobiaceae bacterium]